MTFSLCTLLWLSLFIPCSIQSSFSVMQYHSPAQQVCLVTYVVVGHVNTYTAQLLTIEGERIVIQAAQQATNIYVPEGQINEY